MALPNLRPLNFGEILDAAFTLYRRHFVTFAATALIPTGVMVLAFLLLGGSYIAAMTSPDPEAMMGGAALGSMMLVFLLAGVAFLVAYGALTHQAAQAYTGQPTSVGGGMRVGLRTAPRLLGATILTFLAIFLVMIGLALVATVTVMLLAQGGAAAAMAGTMVVFVVIGVVYLAAIGLFFAVFPAVVVEGAGPFRALERSVRLARGSVLRIVGMMLVTILITYLPVMAVLALTGGFAAMYNPDVVPSTGQFVTQQLLTMGVGVLTTPFMIAVIVLLYFDRRVRTEALDVQMAADRLAFAGD